MSARIRLTEKSEAKLQILPFSLEHSGRARVTQFFDSTVLPDPPGLLRASFRGRPLRGREISLPDGYVGAVLRASGESDPQTFHSTASFSRIISWKWDQNLDSDSLFAAFAWPEVSAALHGPPPEQNLPLQ